MVWYGMVWYVCMDGMVWNGMEWYGCMDVWMYGCMDVCMYICIYIYIFRYIYIYIYIYGFPISWWDDLNQLIPCFNHGTYVTTTVRDSRKSDHVLTMPTLHGEEVPLLCWGERSECFSCSSGFKLPSQWLCTYIYIYIHIHIHYICDICMYDM